jgi:hypothetical protein
VLKVAAMPAPAPAERSVTFCHDVSRVACEKAEPSAAPIWIFGPSRSTEAPLPIESAEASDLMIATCQRILPPPLVDRVHHLGHAVPFGLGREALDKEDDDRPSDSPTGPFCPSSSPPAPPH